MDISFDNRGFLQPAVLIEMNLNEIEQYFITGFPTETSRRYLWTELLRFLDDFSNLITQDYDCWIDGSFISKKWSPQDIDVLIELHYQDFEDKGILLQKQFIQHSFESNYKGIDAYIHNGYWLLDIKDIANTWCSMFCINAKYQNHFPTCIF